MEAKLYGQTPSDIRSPAFQYHDRNKLWHSFSKTQCKAGKKLFKGFMRGLENLKLFPYNEKQGSINLKRTYSIIYNVLNKTLFTSDNTRKIPSVNISNVEKNGDIVCQIPRKIVAKRAYILFYLFIYLFSHIRLQYYIYINTDRILY